MANRKQAGFTLIEVMFVIAIAGALAAIVLVGFSSLRRDAQFSGAIDKLRETVVAQRTEALTTVKSGGGTNASTITFGRLLTFTPGSDQVRVQTLTTANNSSPSAGQPVNVLTSETTTVSVPWGVRYAGTTVANVAFVRSAIDGSLQTAINPTGSWGSAPYSYGFFAPGGSAQELMFQDVNGRRAYIGIDPGSNSVTRRFQ